VPLEQSPQALGELIARNGEGALEALSTLVTLATSGGPGRVDPAPLIDAVLVARANARAAGQYELSDQLRDAILTIGAEVKDGPNGATWHFRDNL
jgi:cysteinyl-tRNA synthetase